MDKKSLNLLLDHLNKAFEEMDAIADGEDQKETCAETEDLLFFIESIDPNDEDADEEVRETMEQLIEMLDSVEGDDAFAEAASVLRNSAEFAIRNL